MPKAVSFTENAWFSKMSPRASSVASVRQVEALAVPLIDHLRPVAELSAGLGRLEPVEADLGAAFAMAGDVAAEMLHQHLRAEADAEERRALLQRDADPVDLAACTKSSGSLALIGPPKMTAPACSSIVSGSGSPKRGRADVERKALGRQHLPELAGARMLLVQDDQDLRRSGGRSSHGQKNGGDLAAVQQTNQSPSSRPADLFSATSCFMAIRSRRLTPRSSATRQTRFSSNSWLVAVGVGDLPEILDDADALVLAHARASARW